MELLIERAHDPRHNLAREEILLTCVTSPALYLWRNGPSVIVGRHQHTAAEVDCAYAADHEIPVVRRITGGGAVYHDLGNVNLSYLFPDGDAASRETEGMALLLDLLHSLDVPAVASGRNDICVETAAGRWVKIAGTAMTLRGARGVFHACLLFDTDRSVMERVLTPPADKLTAKGIASVRSRTANLREICPQVSHWSQDAFFAHMAAWFEARCRRVEHLPGERDDEIARLRSRRYDAWAWNHGRDPAGALQNSWRFPVGQVTVSLQLDGGRIRQCVFFGDYLDGTGLQALAAALCGQPFDMTSITQVLADFDLTRLFQAELPQVCAFLTGKEMTTCIRSN